MSAARQLSPSAQDGEQRRALARTCSRLAGLIKSGLGELYEEIEARACAVIVPASLRVEHPFLEQAREERTSLRQLRAMKRAADSAALHCASVACCGRLQKTFTAREVRRHAHCSGNRSPPSIRPIAERADAVGVSPDGKWSFVCARVRRPRSELLDESGGESGSSFVLKHVTAKHEQVAEVLLPELELAPQQIAVDSSGQHAALLMAVNSTDASLPLSQVCVWTSGSSVLSAPVKPPSDLSDAKAVHAQAAWFGESALLVVCWSSCHFHQSGSFVGGTDTNDTSGFATYSLCGDSRRGARWVLESSSSFFTGEVRAVKPRLDGASAVVVLGTATGHTTSLLIDSFSHTDEGFCRTAKIEHSSALARPGRRQSLGPFAAAVCPRGEAVAAIHRVGMQIYIEVLLRKSDGDFTSACSVDATHCCFAPDGSPWMFQDVMEEADLPAPYAVSWSPCGRYALLMDQRSRYGVSSDAAGVLIVDTQKRKEGGGLRIKTLADGGYAAPKHVDWAPSGLWVQGRRGCNLLTARYLRITRCGAFKAQEKYLPPPSMATEIASQAGDGPIGGSAEVREGGLRDGKGRIPVFRGGGVLGFSASTFWASCCTSGLGDGFRCRRDRHHEGRPERRFLDVHGQAVLRLPDGLARALRTGVCARFARHLVPLGDGGRVQAARIHEGDSQQEGQAAQVG